MYELPEYADLARVTETCKHPNQIPFLGICSGFPCFTAVVLVCLCAASLMPLLAIFSRSQLSSLSIRRRASAFIKMQCRGVKKMQDNGKVKESVYFLGWNNVFFAGKELKQQACLPRRHDASTMWTKRLWLIQNILINM